MTAQVLATELANIIQDSKRRHPDIKTAAEKSLSELKALPNTSESQLASDLKKRPHFVKPFLLSCHSKTPKLVISSLACLQRLVVSNGLANENLKEILDGLRESAALAQDVQLRILQLLPSLLQNYGKLITGDLLATALQLCFVLLASRAAVISNTAAATLQQLVVSVFDRVVQEDDANEENYVLDVPIEDGEKSVGRAALDAYRLLNDLCLLVEGQKPEFLQPVAMPPNLGLELIESILSNHAEVVTAHPEQIHVLRGKLLPFTIRVLSERLPFSITVRAMRLLPIIFSNMLSVLSTECEMVLSLLNHSLEPDSSVLWKRVLCMEVLKGIHAEPSLVRSMFKRFDEQDGRRNIIQDQLSVMVRLASEKPAIIGLGQHSTFPESTGQNEEDMDEMAALQAEGISGTIGVAMTIRSSTAPGISVRLSNMRVACLEQLDKNEPPLIPPSYLYSLDLACMNLFSEGLARFLLPFTVPSETKSKSRRKTGPSHGETPGSIAKREERNSIVEDDKPKLSRTPTSHAFKLPINPLTLETHSLYSQIQTSYKIVDTCWPALLAAYSTFFHAALDSEYYRGLVRSFQKFTQIAGLLMLSTPRDAFLTTLGKNAVPSGSAPPPKDDSRDQKSTTGSSKEKSSTSDADSSSAEKTRGSFESTRASLNARNLLCLRALLNLGIALGPVLASAWTIILENLQQADLIIAHINSQRRQNRAQEPPGQPVSQNLTGDIGSEIAAVGAAATRMIESTNDLPDSSYLDVITSLCGLFRDLREEPESPVVESRRGGKVKPKHHRKSSSITGSVVGQAHDARLNLFVLDQIGKMLEYNEFRFLENSVEENGWSILTRTLRNVISTRQLDASIRLQACKVLMELIVITASGEVFEEIREDARLQGLVELRKQIERLHVGEHESFSASKTKASKSCEGEIHWMLLETLHSVLEQYGDSLSVGWENVFAVATSVFDGQFTDTQASISRAAPRVTVPNSPKLMRSAFSSMQLICSDFLGSLPSACLPVLLNAIYAFCAQQEEFNISLTSTTLYCSVADHLWQDESSLDFSENEVESSAESGHSDTRSLKSAMFFRLLLLLLESTADQRQEIRHGAIHSIFRILDTCSEKLRPENWISCQKTVLLTLFTRNEEAYKEACEEDSDEQSAASNGWNETATILLDNNSTIFALQLQAMLKQDEFKMVWSAFTNHLRQLLERQSLNVSASVFTALEKVLSEVGSEKDAFEDYAQLAWRIWLHGNPVTHKDTSRKITDNQAAVLAYLQCFNELYSLLEQSLDVKQIRLIIEQVHLSIRSSSPTSYPSDINSMTSVQTHAVKCLTMIKHNVEGSISEVLGGLSSLITFAFDRDRSIPDRRGPTFVALAKVAMDLLIPYIAKYKESQEIYTDGGLASALHSLYKPMHSKYNWDIEEPDPRSWRKATRATVDVLHATMPFLKDMEIPKEDLSRIWEAILANSSEILSADTDSEIVDPSAPGDEDFDIEAFLEIYQLLIPNLGAANVPGELRRSFANSLLQNSFIHEPHPDDLPMPGEEPLEALDSVHIGRTNDLFPSRRSKMSYTALDKLFDLVAIHSDPSSSSSSSLPPPASPSASAPAAPATNTSTSTSRRPSTMTTPLTASRIRLAQAAAPYLILRAALTLKAYILDQPLRGRRMPQPLSQRRELLHVLRQLVALESEPKAIPDAPGVASRHRKHLYRVYGLVVRALPVAAAANDDDGGGAGGGSGSEGGGVGGGGEVHAALTAVVDAVAQDFGL